MNCKTRDGSGNLLGYTLVRGERPTDNHYEIDPEQADTVKRIFELYLDGNGVKSICRTLIEEKRLNASGIVKWQDSQISRTIANRAYCGYIQYNRSSKESFLSKRVTNHDSSTYVYIKSDKVPVIIDDDDWLKVQEIKNSRKRKQTGVCQCKRPSNEKYIKKLVCSCGATFKRFKWHTNENGTERFGYQCRNQVNNHKAHFRTENGLDATGYCDLPSVADWKLDMMLTTIVREVWDEPETTIKKLITAINDNYEAEKEINNSVDIKKLETKIAQSQQRLQALDLKWPDQKLSDEDHNRLSNVIKDQIASDTKQLTYYQVQITTQNSVTGELETKMDNLKLIQTVLYQYCNIANLAQDDAFIDSFVARIVPCENRTYKWYLNIGNKRGWSAFSESHYQLYDYFTIGFEQAGRYRREVMDSYLRKNQWEDHRVEIYVRIL